VKALVTLGGGQVGFALQQVPEPVPLPGQALVEVSAVSVNHGDLVHAAHAPAGVVRGYDFVGVVRQQAEVGGPPAGRRVAGVVPSGGWAELVAAPVEALAEVPDDLDDIRAAALPLAGLAALYALQRVGRLLGISVIVTGAAGGVGGNVTQLAALGGAHVMALAGAVERAEPLRALGAAEVGSYDTIPADFAADAVIETVGGAAFTAAMSRLAPGGIGVSIGNTAQAEFVLPAHFGQARARFEHAWLSVFAELERHRTGARDLAFLLGLAAAGRLEARAHIVLGWKNHAGLVADLLAQRLTGKAVLTLA
jgi:NADPH:quinone reductase-like Zn-dependent oxidoreductase